MKGGKATSQRILFLLILSLNYFKNIHGFNWTEINLPKHHMKFYFNTFPAVEKICRGDSTCPYKVWLLLNF